MCIPICRYTSRNLLGGAKVIISTSSISGIILLVSETRLIKINTHGYPWVLVYRHNPSDKLGPAAAAMEALLFLRTGELRPIHGPPGSLGCSYLYGSDMVCSHEEIGSMSARWRREVPPPCPPANASSPSQNVTLPLALTTAFNSVFSAAELTVEFACSNTIARAGC